MQKTILAVDDSAPVRKFVMLALKSDGFRVITATDGMQALEILATENIDLLITDLNMPNIDGFELIKSVRSNPLTMNIPIIILSSLANNIDIQNGLDLGANSYLIKPFNTRKMQYEVSKYLN